MAFSLIALPLALLLYLVVHTLRSRSRNALPLPPGPRGMPLLGNLGDLPKPGVPEWLHWLTFKDRFGPISSLSVFGKRFVIVNDRDITLELLRDQAAINSGRPRFVFGGEMVGLNNIISLMQSTDKDFPIHRRNITKVTSSNVAVSVFDRVQEEETAHFLLNMLRAPEKLFGHIRMEAAAVILRITYGYTPDPNGKDPLVDLVKEAMDTFALGCVPGKWLVDVMPFMRYLPDWFPGTGFKAEARRMANHIKVTAEMPYAFAKKQMSENKHKISYVSQAIDNSGLDASMEHIHKWSAVVLYLGGADTTVSALMSFFLAMTLFPEVQMKAREELDRVIGGSRLPVSKDRPNLPYIEACVKEAHRWHPVVPMGMPHTSNQDQTIRGYRIPKGSTILSNVWWFTHDPAVYPEPMVFRPERYLTTDKHVAEPDPRTYTFGYGRRICPGRYVADNALFITIAQSLAVFDISKAQRDGRPVEPVLEFETGIVSHPLPYEANIEPRSEMHRNLILKAEEEYPWGEPDAEALQPMESFVQVA